MIEVGEKVAQLNFQHTQALLQLSQASNANRITDDLKKKPKPIVTTVKPMADDTIYISLAPQQHVPQKVVVIEMPDNKKETEHTIMNDVTESLMSSTGVDKIVMDKAEEATAGLQSSDESGEDDNMIIISSSEMQTPSADVSGEEIDETDESNEEVANESAVDKVVTEIVDAAKDKVQDAPSVVENLDVLEATTPVVALVKKPTKPEDEGLLGGIVSALIDDDDDDDDDEDKKKVEKDEDDESASAEESSEEDDDDDEDEKAEEEEEEEDEEDEDGDKKKKPVTAEEDGGDSSNSTGDKTKKKKKDALSFTSIGETLGLSRIFRSNQKDKSV